MIMGLNNKEKEIISLKILANLSFDEIGKLLGEPVGTVKWRYYRAINTLKLLLGNLAMFIVTFIIGISNKFKEGITGKESSNYICKQSRAENTEYENIENIISNNEIEGKNEIKEEVKIIVKKDFNIDYGKCFLTFSGIFLIFTMIFSIFLLKHQLKRKKKASKLYKTKKGGKIMKKKVVIILSVVIVLMIGAVLFFKMSNKQKTIYRVSSDYGIQTVLSLEDEIKEDAIWCGSFQLIWNDLKNELAKQDIVFSPQLEVVKNLNKETFKTTDISEDYYYKKLGYSTFKLKDEIEKEIKKKFNEKSEILDSFSWSEKEIPGSYFLYAMLKKEFRFEKAFEELEKGRFGKYNNVEYFGIKDDDTDELKKQVIVLYYNSSNDFAIKLKTKQEDEVILCKNPNGKTFNEIYKNILKEQKKYTGSKYLQEEEKLKVPNISLKEMNEFKEIENKPFFFSNGEESKITQAIQTIEFELDRTGGKVKSEAAIRRETTAINIPENEIRKFFLDDTFAIFLVEEGKEAPYFAAKISDISKFQPSVDKNNVIDDIEPVNDNVIMENDKLLNEEREYDEFENEFINIDEMELTINKRDDKLVVLMPDDVYAITYKWDEKQSVSIYVSSNEETTIPYPDEVGEHEIVIWAHDTHGNVGKVKEIINI